MGHFPTQKELQISRKSSVAVALWKYHGGFDEARKRMGYTNTAKPLGYWLNFANVKKELSDVINDLGHFPTFQEFKSLDRADICSAIQKHHRGLDEVKERLGYSSSQRPKKYWKGWDNIEKELLPVIKQLGHFPTKPELENLGRSDISNGITKYHGGMNSARRKLDYKVKKRKNGELKDIELLKREIETMMDEHPEFGGAFPSSHWLRTHGYTPIDRAIYMYHGGIETIKQMLESDGTFVSERQQLEGILVGYTKE